MKPTIFCAPDLFQISTGRRVESRKFEGLKSFHKLTAALYRQVAFKNMAVKHIVEELNGKAP